MLIFGTKFWAWGSALTQAIWTCSKCGFHGQFIEKKGMTFFTLYWIIPIFPVSGMKQLAQCPQCKTRYQNNTPPGGANGSQPPLSDPWS